MKALKGLDTKILDDYLGLCGAFHDYSQSQVRFINLINMARE